MPKNKKAQDITYVTYKNEPRAPWVGFAHHLLVWVGLLTIVAVICGTVQKVAETNAATAIMAQPNFFNKPAIESGIKEFPPINALTPWSM